MGGGGGVLVNNLGGVLVNNLGHQNSKLPVSEEVAKSLTNITWSSFFFFFFFFFNESSLMSDIFYNVGWSVLLYA